VISSSESGDGDGGAVKVVTEVMLVAVAVVVSWLGINFCVGFVKWAKIILIFR